MILKIRMITIIILSYIINFSSIALLNDDKIVEQSQNSTSEFNIYGLLVLVCAFAIGVLLQQSNIAKHIDPKFIAKINDTVVSELIPDITSESISNVTPVISSDTISHITENISTIDVINTGLTVTAGLLTSAAIIAEIPTENLDDISPEISSNNIQILNNTASLNEELFTSNECVLNTLIDSYQFDHDYNHMIEFMKQTANFRMEIHGSMSSIDIIRDQLLCDVNRLAHTIKYGPQALHDIVLTPDSNNNPYIVDIDKMCSHYVTKEVFHWNKFSVIFYDVNTGLIKPYFTNQIPDFRLEDIADPMTFNGTYLRLFINSLEISDKIYRMPDRLL